MNQLTSTELATVARLARHPHFAYVAALGYHRCRDMPTTLRHACNWYEDADESELTGDGSLLGFLSTLNMSSAELEEWLAVH